ncbi:MAG: 50S ribosomal protein L6 [Acidobacteria bacterium]|nr:MAG: 50S ribosomal protein L6 [Acidobacteriota bacterium]REK07124.1 MAG: 50S ribosomal protein L6 [Acidobacteriota bacterium]
MSRIGKMPIELSGGAKVDIRDHEVLVEGPKGKLTHKRLPGIEIKLDGDTVTLESEGTTGPERALYGLQRALLANAVTGVVQGFTKELEIVGVGYRGEVQGKNLSLSLGFSHPVVYPIPEGITVEIDKNNKVTVGGIDKQRVGQVAAELRALRPPDPYKGKGIRYAGERLRIKEGKSSG